LQTISEFVQNELRNPGITLEALEKLFTNGSKYTICNGAASCYRYTGDEENCDLKYLGITVIVSNYSGNILSVFN